MPTTRPRSRRRQCMRTAISPRRLLRRHESSLSTALPPTTATVHPVVGFTVAHAVSLDLPCCARPPATLPDPHERARRLAGSPGLHPRKRLHAPGSEMPSDPRSYATRRPALTGTLYHRHEILRSLSILLQKTSSALPHANRGQADEEVSAASCCMIMPRVVGRNRHVVDFSALHAPSALFVAARRCRRPIVAKVHRRRLSHESVRTSGYSKKLDALSPESFSRRCSDSHKSWAFVTEWCRPPGVPFESTMRRPSVPARSPRRFQGSLRASMSSTIGVSRPET